MNKKQIIILIVILALLVLGILLKTVVRMSQEDDRTVASKVIHLSPSLLDQIQIGKGSKTPSVDLVKESGVWKVKSLWNAKADLSKIENLLKKLWRAMQAEEFRAKGKQFFPDFGITGREAFSLKFVSAKKTLMDLRLGIKKAGNDGYFIREANDDSIFLIEEDMADLLGIYTAFEEAAPLGGFWADLRIFDLDPEKVTGITAWHLKDNKENTVLGLMSEVDPQDPLKRSWKFMSKDIKLPMDPEKVLKFVVAMNSIRAQKVVDPAGKEYGFDKPALRLAVTEGNKKTILNVGSKNTKEDLYYVKISDDPTIFGLRAGFFDDLNVEDARFVKEATPAGESGKSASENQGEKIP